MYINSLVVLLWSRKKKLGSFLLYFGLVGFGMKSFAKNNTLLHDFCAISPQAAYQHILYNQSSTKAGKSNAIYTKPQPSLNQGFININKATVAELTQLPKIGVKKAQAIVTYRQTHGDFQSVAELVKVKGIGEKTLMAFEHRLIVTR